MNAAPQLQFIEDGHRYLLDGTDVPSVTKILKPLSDREYACVDRDVMERAALLGIAVHKLIELDTAHVLDEDALDDMLRPYLAQWREFLAASGYEPILCEQLVCSKRYGYAGRLDNFGLLNAEAALIDTKRCASVPRIAGPQTAGYEIALRESCPEAVASAVCGPGAGRIYRYALHLTPKRWQLVPFKDPNDARVFLSALTIHNFEANK